MPLSRVSLGQNFDSQTLSGKIVAEQSLGLWRSVLFFFVVPRLLRSSLIKSLSQISKKRDPHEHTICGSLSYTIGSRPAPRPAHRDLSCWLQDDRRLVATHQTSRLPVLRGYHPSYLSICRSPLFYSATSSSSPRSLVSLAFLPPHLLLLMNV